MKQFNLDEYLRNPSRKVVTRDGREARIICTNRKDRDQPVIALVYSQAYLAENAYTFCTNGLYFNELESELDLLFATEKHEGWVNIYSGSIKYGGEIYDTENDAKNSASSDVVATVKIEWEE